MRGARGEKDRKRRMKKGRKTSSSGLPVLAVGNLLGLVVLFSFLRGEMENVVVSFGVLLAWWLAILAVGLVSVTMMLMLLLPSPPCVDPWPIVVNTGVYACNPSRVRNLSDTSRHMPRPVVSWSIYIYHQVWGGNSSETSSEHKK